MFRSLHQEVQAKRKMMFDIEKENIMTIAVMVLPVMSFRFNVNKKSVDTYYSLPISKKELYIVHYLAPLAALIVPMLVMFLLATALGLALYPAEIIKQGLVNRILSFIVLILMLY